MMKDMKLYLVMVFLVGKLEDNNYVSVDYITSNGDSANGVGQFAFAGRLVFSRNNQEYVVTSGISLVTTGLSARGGEAIEGVESIKKFAPRIYASQNRALTANDYESLIPTQIYPELNQYLFLEEKS